MNNLAGIEDCDKFIQKELERAGVEPIIVPKKRTEVPYKYVGRVGNWVLTRAWKYWVVRAEGKGLPLDVATKMHEKEFPDEMYDNFYGYSTYGNVIRVAGHAGCPHPKEWEDDGYVNTYHIDLQEGLNEFVRTAKSTLIEECISEKTFERLVKLYPKNYICVAKMCDEVLDKTGALLGKVRTEARKAKD